MCEYVLGERGGKTTCGRTNEGLASCRRLKRRQSCKIKWLGALYGRLHRMYDRNSALLVRMQLARKYSLRRGRCRTRRPGPPPEPPPGPRCLPSGRARTGGPAAGGSGRRPRTQRTRDPPDQAGKQASKRGVG